MRVNVELWSLSDGWKVWNKRVLQNTNIRPWWFKQIIFIIQGWLERLTPPPCVWCVCDLSSVCVPPSPPPALAQRQLGLVWPPQPCYGEISRRRMNIIDCENSKGPHLFKDRRWCSVTGKRRVWGPVYLQYPEKQLWHGWNEGWIRSVINKNLSLWFVELTCLVSRLTAIQLKILFIPPHLEFHAVVLCPPAIPRYNAIHLFEMKIFPSGSQSGNQRAIILPQ